MSRLETMEGALAESLTQLDQSLALYKAAGKPEGQLAVLSRMTSVYRSLSMWPQSDAINDELLALAELEDSTSRVATSLVNAAISAASRGDRSKAAEHLYRALRICRKNGYWDLITLALIDFANASSSRPEAENLDRYYLAAVASARRRFDEPRETEAMQKLAEVYLSAGAHSLARSAARKVIVLSEHQGPSSILGDANRLAGVCAANQGDQNEAERYFAEATRIGEHCKDELLKARTLADRGDSEVIKTPARAKALWREARAIFCGLGENSQVLRLDRSLVGHTFEHASRPLRYSEAV
jgi:tetratricopeptide (TPR) repeat protein